MSGTACPVEASVEAPAELGQSASAGTPLPNAIFLTGGAPDPGVYESQVLEYGRAVARLGLVFEHVVFEGVQAWATAAATTRAHVRRLEERFGVRIDLRFVPTPTSPLGVAWIRRGLEAMLARLPGDPVVIQARGTVAGYVAGRLKVRSRRLAVVFDVRGDEVAEAELAASGQRSALTRAKWRRRAVRLAHLRREAARTADYVLVVSHALRDMMIAEGGVRADDVAVIPCCIDPARFEGASVGREELRRSLGIADKAVLVYSGSMAGWQLPDHVAAFVEALARLDGRVAALVLTADVAAAERVFAGPIAQGLCQVRRCDFAEVPRYLAAGDLGLLLRRADAVNRVASPVKFAEYLAAGLAVVASTGVDGVARYLESTGHGVVVVADESPAAQAATVARWLREAPARNPALVAAEARRTFSRATYLPAYRRMLDRLRSSDGL